MSASSPRVTHQSKDGVSPAHRGNPSSRHRKSETRSRIFRELVHMAADQGASITLGTTTAEALQECLDRAVALLRFASAQVDLISDGLPADPDTPLSDLSPLDDPLFEVIENPQGPDQIRPHRYLRMEREARLEVEKLAGMMTTLGIAERVVRVKEAEAALVVAAIRDAAIETGLTHDQVRALGTALRNRIESSATSTSYATADERRAAAFLSREADRADAEVASHAEELYDAD